MIGKSCTLEIVLDRDEVAAGGTVTGFVGVEVDADCRCDGLTLQLQWGTHGSGNRDHGPERPVDLFAGEWRRGARGVHPFEIAVPTGPLTFHGEHVNVEWTLSARANIPWGIDPKAERRVVVTRPRDPVPLDTGPVRLLDAFTASGSMQVLGAYVFLGIVALFHAFIGFLWCIEEEADCVLVAMEGGVMLFTVAALAVLRGALRVRAAERRLGPITLTVPERALPGEPVDVEVAFTPPSLVELTGVRAILEGTETAISGSGTRKKTHTRVFVTEVVELSPARPVNMGEAVRLRGTLRLPPDAAADFSSASNTVRWDVKAIVSQRGRADVERSRRVAVDR